MTTNIRKGEVTLEVGGTSYTLALNFGAMRAAEEAISTPEREVFWDQILANASKGSATYAGVFVWALLRKHHAAMTMADTEAFIDAAGGMDGLAEALAAVRDSQVPDPADVAALNGSGKARPRKAPTAGTGAKSTSPPVASA